MELLLKKIIKLLSKTYHCDFFLDNAIAISFHEGEPHFALVVVDEDTGSLNYSVAVDAPDPYSICEVLLRLMNFAKIELSEPFYMNDEGTVFWSEEAYKEAGILSAGVDELDNMESPGKLVN